VTFPFGRAVTLILRTPAGKDPDYGDDVYTTSERITHGAFDPGTSGETEESASTQPTLYLPPGVDVNWLAQARVDGVTYEVDGQPGAWKHDGTGWNAGVVVRLKAAVRPAR
jgi:hypothetical protein